MSIRSRLASYIFLMTGFLVILGGILLIGGPLVLRAYQKSLDTMDALIDIRELRSIIQRQKTSLSRYLLIDEPQELLSFEESSDQAKKMLEIIKSKEGNRLTSWYTDISEDFHASMEMATRVTRLYKGGNRAKAYDEASGKLLPKFQVLLEKVLALESAKEDEAQQMYHFSRRISEKGILVVLGVLALAFLFGMVLFRSLYRAVMKPLQILRQGAEEFGKGHWDHRIDLTHKNEFGALAQSFNTMADNVKQLQLQAVHMDRMSAVGQLAGGVAHEINNPLTAVLGQAQILLAKIAETEPIHAQIKKIEQAALRCKKIVRGLLDFSRPGQASYEEIGVNDIVASTLDLCEADLKRARVLVEKHFAESLPKVEGSSSELQQVLLNIINNALQAMARGGTLTIETKSFFKTLSIPDRRQGVPPKVIEGSWVEVSLRDTGVGIAKEHLTRIFEPFFTTKEIGKGTGLGLSVSMGIVRKHGGDLTVESGGLNRGSTFRMTLPVRKTSGTNPMRASKGGMP